jgi:CheY-like chemotaxis protein
MGARPLVLIVEDDPETRSMDADAGLDGIELCRKLRADERTRSIPVLAITGYDDRHYPDRARTAGADGVLMKPCDGDVLVSEARRLLSR